MKGVVELGNDLNRAIVIRPVEGREFVYFVGALERSPTGGKAKILGTYQGAASLLGAWKMAREQQKLCGLPILDLASPPARGPRGPGGSGGLRMAA